MEDGDAIDIRHEECMSSPANYWAAKFLHLENVTDIFAFKIVDSFLIAATVIQSVWS